MQLLHCVQTVVIVVDHLHGLALVLIFCLSSPLTPSSPPSLPPFFSPSGSEASLGNSLNTSEEELHTAGITLAPKGTRDSHQPDSSRCCSDHYRFCSDRYHSHTKKRLYIKLGALLFLHNKAPRRCDGDVSALLLSTSPAGVVCAVMLCGEAGSGVFK